MQIFSHIYNKFLKETMGNKIGIEIDSQQFKLAYRQTDEKNIAFIKSLKSDYLIETIQQQTECIFLFRCTRQQFGEYPNSKNVSLLREHYRDILAEKELLVFTNQQTISLLSSSEQILGTLKQITNRQPKLVHRVHTQTSLQAIKFLLDKKQIFGFATSNQLSKLHQIGNSKNLDIETVESLPDRFLFISIRSGLSMYQIAKDKPITRLQGSIIGQKTLLSMLKLMFPKAQFASILSEALSKGSSLNVDLLVDDIYGKSSHNLGLDGKLIASSLGKYGNRKDTQSNNYDIVKSLIISFAINIATLVSLGLKKYNMQVALILSDKIHGMPFYHTIHSLLKKGYAPQKKLIFAKNSPFLSCLGSLQYKV